jgi:hypothetical protein
VELVDQVDVAPTWARKDLGQTGGGEISRRICRVNSAETYVANAVSMWSSFAPIIATSDLVLGIEPPGGRRYVVRRPLDSEPVELLLEGLRSEGRVVVEDPFGAMPPLVCGALTVLRMPVMNRPPGEVISVDRPGVTVAPVADTDALGDAERVIVDGFPYRHFQPWLPGCALPSHVLDVPGWQTWLARRDGEPAAAGYTYDDGVAVGVYWLATLAAHRGVGLGRAVMTAMLAAHPGRIATLVATEAGVPLYADLGFAAVSTATWYIRTS